MGELEWRSGHPRLAASWRALAFGMDPDLVTAVPRGGVTYRLVCLCLCLCGLGKLPSVVGSAVMCFYAAAAQLHAMSTTQTQATVLNLL